MTASSLVTILFTDLVGSTELGTRIGDDAADELRRRARSIPYEGHCRTDFARSLARRGDVDGARREGELAIACVEGRGMDGPDGFEQTARDLLVALDTGGPLP